jgi:DNA-binding response OmpR family regulator
MENETILIVDDSPHSTKMLHEMLASLNYQAVTAFDGKSGLLIALERKPDLIILDMNMPIMSGMQTLRALRQENCRSPVIFMAAYGSEQIAIEAFRLGVRDYLRKPFDRDDTKAAIDRALQETRLMSEREMVDRSLLSAEAVRLMAVTLSHYLNNYLTALNGSLQLLDETLPQDYLRGDMLQLLEESRKSAANIEAVTRALLTLTNVKLSSYTDSTCMLDIETAVKQELERLKHLQLT